LGVNATALRGRSKRLRARGFNKHPPLGVNATAKQKKQFPRRSNRCAFQRSPTLGGECYLGRMVRRMVNRSFPRLFQRAPTLGGECYQETSLSVADIAAYLDRFQRAPTLGGECYEPSFPWGRHSHQRLSFQRAPTLGGECYTILSIATVENVIRALVSTGTHPWG